MNEIKKTARKATKTSAKGLWWNAFWPGLALACFVGPALPIFGGCAFIKEPEPEPAPTKVPEVPVHPDVYHPAVATDAASVKPLTDDSTAQPNLIPDFYQLVTAETGTDLILQAYRLNAKGQPYIAPLDKPVKVKLGGIVSPDRNESGWAEATAVTQNWLGGRRLEVDEDKKFPLGLDGRNIVQIRIKSEVNTKAPGGAVTKTEEVRPFNQVLVRAGYAFVNLITPTSFDFAPWIVDEEYARGVRSEPADWQLKNAVAGQPTPKPAPGTPVGLWARGIYPYKNFRPGAVASRKVATATDGKTVVITGLATAPGSKVVSTKVTKTSASKQTAGGQVTQKTMTKKTITTTQ